MTPSRFVFAALVLSLPLGRSSYAQVPANPTIRPNIIVIVADDLGVADLGCYGARDISTPVLDRLAKQGTRFTQFYSNGPECSPTRTALLTGWRERRGMAV